jgi:hypothetical protein
MTFEPLVFHHLRSCVISWIHISLGQRSQTSRSSTSSTSEWAKHVIHLMLHSWRGRRDRVLEVDGQQDREAYIDYVI